MRHSRYFDKIRILFLADQIYGATGGFEQHLSFLLRNLPPDLYEIHFGLLRNTGYFNEYHYPVRPKIFNFSSFSRLQDIIRCTWEIRNLIREREIGILHTFSTDSELLGIIAIKIANQCSLVVTRRNMGHKHTKLSLWRTRFTNGFVTHFLTNSYTIKKYVSKMEFLSDKKIDVIYNPINLERLKDAPDRPYSKEDFGIRRGDLLIGIVANIRPIKDHITFLLAAHKVLKSVSNVKFLLVGNLPGDYDELPLSQKRELCDWEKKLRSLIKELGIGKNIIFTGKVENPLQLMRLMDIGILTSQAEGLSNSLIEYGAVGLPSVATDVGGNREIVLHKKTGFIVPPSEPESLASRIIELIHNEELRKEYGYNAQKFVLNMFRPEKILKEYFDYHSNIINSFRDRKKTV